MSASKLTLAVLVLCSLALSQLGAATKTCSKTSTGASLITTSKGRKIGNNKYAKVYNVHQWTFPEKMHCDAYPTINLCYNDQLRFTDCSAAHAISLSSSAACPSTAGPTLVKQGNVLTPKHTWTSKNVGAYLKKNQKKGVFYIYCPVAGHCEGGMTMKVNVKC